MTRTSKILLGVASCLLHACAQHPDPVLSSISEAPDRIRDGLVIKPAGSGLTSAYSVSIWAPEDPWIDLRVRVENDHVYASGHFAYAEDEDYIYLDNMLVDTGYDGGVSFAIDHPMAGRVWLSREHGSGLSSSMNGRQDSWSGAGVALIIQRIIVSPFPAGVSRTDTAVGLHKTPLLGQAWFNLAESTWIDLTEELIAVSYDPGSAEKVVSAAPDLWAGVPWRAAKPGEHRFVPIRVGDTPFEAVIDTGSQMELFLNAVPDPGTVERPWLLLELYTGTGRSLIHTGTTTDPIHLGGIEAHDVTLAWPLELSTTVSQTPSGRPFAVLGVPFLRRFPVLLDHRNDRAYFFIGDRADLPSFAAPGPKQDAKPGAVPDARLHPGAAGSEPAR